VYFTSLPLRSSVYTTRSSYDWFGSRWTSWGSLQGVTSTSRTADGTLTSGDSLCRLAKYVNHKSTNIADDISAIAMPLVEKFPNATMEARMAHGDLRYDDICIGSKGTGLNYNLVGACSDKCAPTATHGRNLQQTQSRLSPTN
jgi:hypothetical protein